MDWNLSKILRYLLTHCPFREVFHVYCPGCGGTRAVFALARLRLLTSLRLNPLPLLTILWLVIFILAGKREPGLRRKTRLRSLILLGMVLMVFILYSAVRNILLLGWGIDLVGDFS